jgi:hypothetical protein
MTRREQIEVRTYIIDEIERARILKDCLALKDAAHEVLHPEGHHPTTSLFVKSPTGRTLTLAFDASKKICDIKSELAGRLALLPCAFELRVIGGKPLF